MIERIFLLSIAVIVFVSFILLIFLITKNHDTNEKEVLEKLIEFEKYFSLFDKSMKDEFSRNRKEIADSLIAFQTALSMKFDLFSKNTGDSLTKNFAAFTQNFAAFTQTLSSMHADLTKQTTSALKNLQDGNEKKLEQMRLTVDEKLQSTLEKRLSVSFQIVTKQLEAVQKGLGEMQTLASDVGGLKRALTNVKTAGGIGEVQLESLLSEFLSPEQYVKNAHPNPHNEKKVVEFAVKIPSKIDDGTCVLLPIDSKYPATVWDKLSLAYESADKTEIEMQKAALVSDIKKMARDIKDKYIETPYTTDFAVLFLPFESLYSEVLRIPGLFQEIQSNCKTVILGPTTLTAFLHSLQMGFRTLAIEKETSKVWDLLGSVKSEFGKFGDVLAQTKKKLQEASNSIEKAETRTRVIERKLSKVELLPDESDERTVHERTDLFLDV